MTYKVSDFIVDRLVDWDVSRVYGYPGDAINPLLASINASKGAIKFVQVRHGSMASFMASAHAKFTGDVGVCISSSGAGAAQLLPGLYDAKMDNQPVVAIVGQQPRSSIGASYFQDVDLKSLFKDVAHEYVEEAMMPAQVRHLLDRAIRIARAERTVTCLILPSDVLGTKATPRPKREHGSTFSGVGYTKPRIVPHSEELRRAAQILNEGRKVSILVGAGALGASQEVAQVAELLGAGVAKALLGKAVLPDDLPYVTGSIGMLGTEATAKMMANCDTLLMIGSNFPYAEFLPKEGNARGVQIDVSAKNLSLRYPMEISLEGDSKETLKELIPLLKRKDDRRWRSEVESYVSHWWKVLEGRAMQPATPINPQLLFWEISKHLPSDAILCSDSGTSVVWFARDLRIKSGMMASVSGRLAAMGCSIPYAISAKFAHPERPVFAFIGDGAMQMSGNNELITVSKYWRQWTDPRFITVVLNNGDLSFTTWEMRVLTGDVKFPAAQELPDFPYARYADSIGLKGISVHTPDGITPALESAFASDRPVVLEVKTDPNVPPLPPHITIDQARAFTYSMLKGDPETPSAFGNSLGQLLQSFLPK